MESRKIDVSESLWHRLEKAAAEEGYGSTLQYVTSVLEREASRGDMSVSDSVITQKMRDLGYLDYGLDI